MFLGGSSTATDVDSYHYDDSGNRALDDTGAVAVAADNRLRTDARYSYEYDQSGRLTERTKSNVQETFAWDDRGLLLSVTRQETQGTDTQVTKVVEYAYDAAGRRTGRRVSAAATFDAPLTVTEQSITQYDGTSRLAEFNATGKISRHYLHGPGPNEVLAVDQSGAGATPTAWAFTDQLGSVVTWGHYDSGANTWTFEHTAFDAFGNRDAGLSSTTSLMGGQALPQLWAGHPYESALDLYHMQARWYDPQSGRFLLPDPLSYAAGDSNLYRYVGNNTTTFIDPTGESAWGKAGKLIVEKLTKQGIKRSWYQIHHIIGREVFHDGKVAKWLTKLGVKRDCEENLMALPTKLGKQKGFMKAAAQHQGGPISEYVKKISDRIGDLMKQHVRGEITDAEAKRAIDNFQRELRDGLENGTIALSREENNILNAGGVLSVGGVLLLGSNVTVDSVKKAEIARWENEQLHKAWKEEIPLTGTYFFGEESWIGWCVDLFNPFDDLRTIEEAMGDLQEAYPNVELKMVPEDGGFLPP